MTAEPFYEPRILKMRLEEYAKIAVDGGLWLVGERLAQNRQLGHGFVPDARFAYNPRHRETAIIALCRVSEEVRHRIFIMGFLTLPYNGAQGTFRYLLVTHTDMLHEALRIAWKHRRNKTIDIRRPSSSTAIELLHKLALPR
jgi:hypothetical protein